MATTPLSEIPPLSEAKKARFAALVEEYQELIDTERHQGLTSDQQQRLRDVETEMDDIEACMPETIQMFQRLDETERQLNALLEYVESLPDK